MGVDKILRVFDLPCLLPRDSVRSILRNFHYSSCKDLGVSSRYPKIKFSAQRFICPFIWQRAGNKRQIQETETEGEGEKTRGGEVFVPEDEGLPLKRRRVKHVGT